MEGHGEASAQFPCLLCEFAFDTSQQALEHLASLHQFVIADVDKIGDMKKYLSYWAAKKLSLAELPNYTSIIDTRTPEGTTYFLLSDVLPEDKQIREKLKQELLCHLLEVQRKERNDPSFERKCLFCTKIFRGRDVLFSHMLDEHHFNIGRADNLVFIPELLDHLQRIIDSVKCIYCGKTFKNHAVLKKHMRKKKHFKVNSKDTTYDKFYMINYLEPGKKWEDLKSERDEEEEGEEEWDDWCEDVSEDAACLFCKSTFATALAAYGHAKEAHQFDFFGIKADWGLDFYGCIKLINYIRRQITERRCPHCDEPSESYEALQAHMTQEKHFSVRRDADFWKNPQYLMPIKENDALLTGFDLDSDSDDDDEAAQCFQGRGKDGEDDDENAMIQAMLEYNANK